MQSIKKCVKCGRTGIARINAGVWLCYKCAMEATIFSLNIGQPVIWARRSDPQFVLMPTTIHKN